MPENPFEPLLERLPVGWYRSTADIAAELEGELAIELTQGHLLDGVPVKVIAHRLGSDDILCWHTHEPLRFTVIHLSYSGSQGYDAKHPWVEVDGTFDDFCEYEQKWLR